MDKIVGKEKGKGGDEGLYRYIGIFLFLWISIIYREEEVLVFIIFFLWRGVRYFLFKMILIRYCLSYIFFFGVEEGKFFILLNDFK